MKLLLEYGATVSPTTGNPPLFCAAIYNRVDIARLLLAHGANVRAPMIWGGNDATTANLEPPFATGIDGMTALHQAALTGDVAMLDLLLSHGTDINERDTVGRTPIMYATEAGTENIRYLLRHGADASITDRHGKTALEHAKSLRLYIEAGEANKGAMVRLLTEAAAAKSKHH